MTCSNFVTKLRLRDARPDPICHVTKLFDSHDEITLCIVNIHVVVAVVEVYGEYLLTWLPDVCNHDLPNSLLAFIQQSIFQVS